MRSNSITAILFSIFVAGACVPVQPSTCRPATAQEVSVGEEIFFESVGYDSEQISRFREAYTLAEPSFCETTGLAYTLKENSPANLAVMNDLYLSRAPVVLVDVGRRKTMVLLFDEHTPRLNKP